jgi:hypothetical protein
MTTKQRIKDLIPDLSDVERLENHAYYQTRATDMLKRYLASHLPVCLFGHCREISAAKVVKLIREFDLNLWAVYDESRNHENVNANAPSPFTLMAISDYLKAKDLKYALQLLDLLFDDQLDVDHKNYIREIAIYLSDSYDIIYNDQVARERGYEFRGVYLKNNVEIIEAVKKTGDQELIDIIKSANRVGVTDLKSQLNSLSTKLDVWAKSCLLSNKSKNHPITKLIDNFRQALNDCPLSGRSESVQHGIANPQEKYTINLQSQRILFDMGLTLVRLKLEFQNLEDVIKNEQ